MASDEKKIHGHGTIKSARLTAMVANYRNTMAALDADPGPGYYSGGGGSNGRGSGGQATQRSSALVSARLAERSGGDAAEAAEENGASDRAPLLVTARMPGGTSSRSHRPLADAPFDDPRFVHARPGER